MGIQVLMTEEEASNVLRIIPGTLPPAAGETIQRLQEKILTAIKAQEFKNSPLVNRIAIAKKKRILKGLQKLGASEAIIKETDDMLDKLTPEQIRDF